jgi:hypothetical protein
MVRPAVPYDEHGTAYYERACQSCGRTMWVQRARQKWCSRACQMRGWRAAVMLAGTHRWARLPNGNWSITRLEEPVVVAANPRVAIWRATSERDWRAQVVRWAIRGGWLVYFTWRSDHSPSGFPDMVLLKGGRLVFAELKAEAGRLSKQQEAWLRALEACDGIDVFVWRPHDEERVRSVLLEGALG